MRLNLNTKINDLITQHPFLLDYLVSYAPEFEKLKSPIARATIGRIATITMAAKLAKLDPAKLLNDVAAAIEKSTGQAPQLGEPEPATPEQLKQRREALAAIVRELHEGKSPAELEGPLRPAARGRRPRGDRQAGERAASPLACRWPRCGACASCTWTCSARASSSSPPCPRPPATRSTPSWPRTGCSSAWPPR
ncbi:MAG: DUF1858 domain-containing protein [Myxococcales bacterium]